MNRREVRIMTTNWLYFSSLPLPIISAITHSSLLFSSSYSYNLHPPSSFRTLTPSRNIPHYTTQHHTVPHHITLHNATQHNTPHRNPTHHTTTHHIPYPDPGSPNLQKLLPFLTKRFCLFEHLVSLSQTSNRRFEYLVFFLLFPVIWCSLFLLIHLLSVSLV